MDPRSVRRAYGVVITVLAWNASGCPESVSGDAGTDDLAGSERDGGTHDATPDSDGPDASIDSGTEPELACRRTSTWTTDNPQPSAAWLNAAWTFPDGATIFVGEWGRIVLADSERLSLACDAGDVTLRGVWGHDREAPGGAWAVGDQGTILRRERGTWARVPTSTTAAFRSVWGSGPNDLWIAGDGIVLRGDGAQFQRVGPAGFGAQAIFGFGPNDVWLIRWSTATHWDGATFTDFHLPRSGDCSWCRPRASIWGAAPNDVWATEGLELYHWDGASWSNAAIALTGVAAMTGRSATEIYASGDRLHRWNGQAWRPLDAPPGPYGAIAADGDGVLAAGVSGYVRRVREAGSTVLNDYITTEWLTAIWGSSDADVWIGGDHGTLLHHSSQGWATLPVSPAMGWVRAIAGSGPDDAWAVSDVLLHWDGTAWKLADSGPELPSEDLAVTGPNDAWGVSGGDILHFDGADWSVVYQDAGVSWWSIWARDPNEVWAVGHGSPEVGGARVRWDGRSWQRHDTSVYDWWRGVRGTNSGQVIMVGQTFGPGFSDPRLLTERWDGARFLRKVWDLSRSEILDVSSNGDDVYALDREGLLLHTRGVSDVWTATPIRADPRGYLDFDLGGLWADPSGGVLISGKYGLIVRFNPRL